MTKHIAVFSRKAVEHILSGEKTIEVRFSKTKIAPFGVISAGDLVYVKPIGSEPIGQFRVKKVIFYDFMENMDLLQIKETFGDKFAESEQFWKSRKGSKYATLIFIDSLIPFLTSPIKVKKKDQRSWVILD